MRQLSSLFLFAVLFLTLACEEETLPPRDLSADYAYFPLELNRSNYYQMDSIVIFNTPRGIVYDTTTAEVRETLVESFLRADGSTAFRGERWQRNDENEPWFFVQTYVESRDAISAQRSEDNLTFTKLVFPLREGLDWDGNAAFDDERALVIGGDFVSVFRGWRYRYLDVAQPVDLATGVNFAVAVYVEQDTSANNLIERRLAHERYAPGVGLIERFIDARDSQCVECCNQNTVLCDGVPWDERAEEGLILRQVFLRRE